MVSNRLVNALIGAVVTVVTSVVPLSPVLGGAVAGYLQRGDNEEGATVGALSGVLVTVPLAVIGTLLVALFTIAPQGGGGLGLVVGVFLLSVLVVGLYAVSLSVVGGVIGAYLAREYRREKGEAFGDDDFGGENGDAVDATTTTTK
jgi:ABC-type spermidine/putrescine transport system permease subunit II